MSVERRATVARCIALGAVAAVAGLLGPVGCGNSLEPLVPQGQDDPSGDDESGPGELDRVDEDLLVLYTFDEEAGDVVHDRSQVEPLLDLKVMDPAATSWTGTGLTFDHATVVSSEGPATKVTQGCLESEAITVEAWVTPGEDPLDEWRRIVTVSVDEYQRNFTLGEHTFGTAGGQQPVNARSFFGRVRTTQTTSSGRPEFVAWDSVGTETAHVVYSWRGDGTEAIYIDGEQVSDPVRNGYPPTFDGLRLGDISIWSENYALAIGNELNGARAFDGEIHLVAVYGRALSPDEVHRNYLAGPRPRG